jgi:hypothetical protein
LSNHWSRVANCRWRLINENNNQKKENERVKLGFAKWTDFYSDNDYEKLYFIEIINTTELNYFHKNNENYSNQVLRTSVETTKVNKQIRTLLEETAWAKYLNNDDIETLRQEIIGKMTTTDKSFQEIRRDYL